MEQVLAVYKRAYDPKRPVLCMDESSKQLIRETRTPMQSKNGTWLYDYEYQRMGTRSLFIGCEPLSGKRWVKVTESRKTEDWVGFMQELLAHYQQAEQITVVMDNLNTHKAEAFYQYLPPDQARALLNRVEWVYTPEHGSWLNMAEIELSVLMGQCLDRRIPTAEKLEAEVMAWQRNRNQQKVKIDWQFQNEEARTKLKHLYPTIIEC